MRPWQQRWGAMGFLAVAGAAPVRAAGMPAPGTELIYTGILERRERQMGAPEGRYRARERLSVLVARADPEQGYTLLFRRDIRPELPLGKEKMPPYAEVVTERYRRDLSPVGNRRWGNTGARSSC